MARPRRYSQKQLKKRLEADGWVATRGGKHVVKMSKAGGRPITIPMCGGQTLSIGLARSILKAAEIEE